MKQKCGVTLISLIITIIILLILAGVTLILTLGDNGIFKATENAAEETKKQTAMETMKLKISDIQVNNYSKEGKFPSLQILADKLCEDTDEIEYVGLTSKNNNMDKITVGNAQSIFTKLKKYPYEFEINTSLEIASINGSSTNNNVSITVADKHLSYLYNNILNKMNDINSIELLLNDSDLFPLIIAVNDNVDYIIDNTDIFLDKILNSENAVKVLSNNEYAKTKINENPTWIATLERCEYAYVEWNQPILSSDSTTVKEGIISTTALKASGGTPAYFALDGKKSNGEGGYWWPNTNPAWWQIKFPYKLRIKSIDYYDQYSTDANNMVVTARLYTDSTKSTPIGNTFSANSAWQKVSISGINENEIITNTIYFYKTVGGAGIGELVINADKFIF